MRIRFLLYGFGTVPVETEAIETDAPGLAVVKRDKTPLGWVIVHIGSGIAVLSPFKTRTVAMEVVERLIPLADWTLDMPTLINVPGLHEKIRDAAGV